MSDKAPVDRAQFVLSEIRATLEWYFDDQVEDDKDAQLAALANAHENAHSHDAISAALFDYATLADSVREQIDGLGGFDVSLIDEAREVGERLNEQSAGPAVLSPNPTERDALQLRNRIAALLYERMQAIRGAARFVFRRHPELVREVTSAYFRQQRAAYRAEHAEETAKSAPDGEGVAAE